MERPVAYFLLCYSMLAVVVVTGLYAVLIYKSTCEGPPLALHALAGK